jgi:hypothetical protein
MKYLDLPALSRCEETWLAEAFVGVADHTLTGTLSAAVTGRINSFLDHVDVGDYIVEGDLEAYSCESGGWHMSITASVT